MESQKESVLSARRLRRILIAVDDVMHFGVAFVLLLCAAMILIRTLPNLLHPQTTGILHVLNDVLLTLIVMELMWPIVRFLKRKPFSLSPFLYIGIISSTRRILMIEAEHSMLAQLRQNSETGWHHLWPMLAELGANVLIILVLAVALRLTTSCTSPAD
ncbi:MAG: phosphate-starvation-inducible PsiE family protein [Thermodesulfobacteriota bacterium]